MGRKDKMKKGGKREGRREGRRNNEVKVKGGTAEKKVMRERKESRKKGKK